MQISVIIPVYNTEKYLEQCLDSVLNQTFQDFEIIIINDGSRDRSQEIIKRYEKNHEWKIKTIYQENQGMAAARNHALDIAEGTYVVCLDSDDFMGESYLETLYRKAEETRADMVLCNYTRVDSEGRVIKAYEANRKENGIRIPSYVAWNRIIRRSVLEKYKIRFKNGATPEDVPVTLKLEIVAENIQVISMAEYYYRTNPTSITANFKKKSLKEIRLFFDAMTECIDFWTRYKGNIEKEKMEFYVCRIWTSLLFCIGRKCEKRVRYAMIREMYGIMETYFPEYYKNPYVKPCALKKLPLTQRVGTYVFVKSMRWHVLNILSTVLFIV